MFSIILGRSLFNLNLGLVDTHFYKLKPQITYTGSNVLNNNRNLHNFHTE